MKGLRRQETHKFEEFFKLVQAEANKKHSVFFLDCGLGKVFENETVECEDLCGWLIPISNADEFEKPFMENSPNQHNYDDFYVSVDFNIKGDGNPEIIIDDSPNDIKIN